MTEDKKAEAPKREPVERGLITDVVVPLAAPLVGAYAGYKLQQKANDKSGPPPQEPKKD